jgi:hypothetical protein
MVLGLRVHRGPFLTSPLGENFDPKGEVVPRGWSFALGGKFSVHPSILLNSRECSPLGVNEGANIPLEDKISPLGANLTPRGKVHPRGGGANHDVKTGLSILPMYVLRKIEKIDMKTFCSHVSTYQWEKEPNHESLAKSGFRQIAQDVHIF